MVVIGLTGGSGSGKTTALSRIVALGGSVIDCDAVYHTLLEQDLAMLKGIAAAFPEAVCGNAVDRRRLGRLVFGDPDRLKELNAITHPAVFAEVQRRLDSQRQRQCPVAAVDAVALIESGLGRLCDYPVAVLAPQALRIQRLVAREGISEDYAALRIQAQKSNAEFAAQCQYVLYNDTANLEEFEKQCDTLFLQLLGGTNHV